MKTKKWYLPIALASLLAAPLVCAQVPAARPARDALAQPPAGAWLRADQLALQQRVQQHSATASAAHDDSQTWLPVMQEFKALIDNDPELYMLFTQMFEQIPRTPPYVNDPVGNPQVRSYRDMLKLINQILTQAPEFNKTDLVGFPINAIVNWAMGTPAGAAAFLNPKVNRQLKKVLAQWAVFLNSPDSLVALNNHPEKGWLGRDALQAMPTLVQDFDANPALPHYGFKSWDDFFVRRFREGRRPVASPADDNVIANACESAPYKLATQVKWQDQFWIKDQPYSLSHMMDGDPLAQQFVGGTIYQAFLSAASYHRWHSPVSGRIVKTRLIDGSYYAQTPAVGFDAAGPNESQGYITQVASRGLVFIQADNPKIGLMAVLFVGMAEVSSNDITVYEGQHVNKGDQLGMFHFGGSTHALIFRPQVKLDFDLRGQTPGLDTKNIPVRGLLATAR
jgi:phosphatidylserine decarboxylase